jgi:hypothetical protein
MPPSPSLRRISKRPMCEGIGIGTSRAGGGQGRGDRRVHGASLSIGVRGRVPSFVVSGPRAGGLADHPHSPPRCRSASGRPAPTRGVGAGDTERPRQVLAACVRAPAACRVCAPPAASRIREADPDLSEPWPGPHRRVLRRAVRQGGPRRAQGRRLQRQRPRHRVHAGRPPPRVAQALRRRVHVRKRPARAGPAARVADAPPPADAGRLPRLPRREAPPGRDRRGLLRHQGRRASCARASAELLKKYPPAHVATYLLLVGHLQETPVYDQTPRC